MCNKDGSALVGTGDFELFLDCLPGETEPRDAAKLEDSVEMYEDVTSSGMSASDEWSSWILFVSTWHVFCKTVLNSSQFG